MGSEHVLSFMSFFLIAVGHIVSFIVVGAIRTNQKCGGALPVDVFLVDGFFTSPCAFVSDVSLDTCLSAIVAMHNSSEIRDDGVVTSFFLC